MNAADLETGITAGTVDRDPFNGVAEAPRRDRILAGLAEVLVVLGSPWLILIFCAPLIVPFIELIPAVVLLIVLSSSAAFALWMSRRMPNGERLPAGHLVTGLTVIRTADAHRVVRAMDVEGPLRPRRDRVIAGRVAFAAAVLIGVTAVATAGWAVFTFVFQTQDQAAAEARWQAQEPEARAVSGLFRAEILGGGPDAGSRYVVDDAAQALPRYRDHLRLSGATGFEEAGWGHSEGRFEYMFREVAPPAVAPDAPTVNIMVEERDGRFVVTQLTWDAPPETGPAPD